MARDLMCGFWVRRIVKAEGVASLWMVVTLLADYVNRCTVDVETGGYNGKLADMCGAKRARVIWTEKDRNGRTLGRVWCAGIDANAEQVSRGMAWVFDRYVKDRSLYGLQDAARSARLGLWADAVPVPPWEWRKAKGALQYRAQKSH